MTSVGERNLGFPLVHFPGSSRGEDRLPMHMEGIRMQKYLNKKMSKQDLSKNIKKKNLFGNSFCFLFSKTCFREYKKKNNFLVFLK